MRKPQSPSPTRLLVLTPARFGRRGRTRAANVRVRASLVLRPLTVVDPSLRVADASSRRAADARRAA